MPFIKKHRQDGNPLFLRSTYMYYKIRMQNASGHTEIFCRSEYFVSSLERIISESVRLHRQSSSPMLSIWRAVSVHAVVRPLTSPTNLSASSSFESVASLIIVLDFTDLLFLHSISSVFFFIPFLLRLLPFVLVMSVFLC